MFSGGETSGRAIGRQLTEQGIATLSGNHYPLEVVRQLGLEESGGRVGVVHHNTVAESNRLLDVLVSL